MTPTPEPAPTASEKEAVTPSKIAVEAGTEEIRRFAKWMTSMQPLNPFTPNDPERGKAVQSALNEATAELSQSVNKTAVLQTAYAAVQSELASLRRELEEAKREINGHKDAMVRISGDLGIVSPFQMIALAETNEETYFDILIKHLARHLARLNADVQRKDEKAKDQREAFKEALEHWKTFYESELDRCDKEVAHWQKESDGYGVNFHQGKHSGLVSCDIGLTKLKQALERLTPQQPTSEGGDA